MEKEFLIGEIQIDNNINEVTIGVINNRLKVIVRSNDPGNIPHCHIMTSNSDPKHSKQNGEYACIELDNNCYFNHDADGFMHPLSSKNLQKFIKFIKEPLTNSEINSIKYKYKLNKVSFKNRWEYAQYCWNLGNNRAKSVSNNCPDYNKNIADNRNDLPKNEIITDPNIGQHTAMESVIIR